MNLPPVPPPATRDKSRPPPRPAKASIHQQQQQLMQQQQLHHQQQQSNGSLEPSTSQQARYHSQQQQQPLQLQQQHFSQTDNYVGLSLIPNILDMPATAAAAAAAVGNSTPCRQKAAQALTQTHNQLLVSEAEHVPSSPQQHQQQQQLQQQQSRFHQSARRHAPSTNNTFTSQHQLATPTHINHVAADIDELVDYADVADSIRGLSATAAATTAAAAVDAAATSSVSASNENLLRTEPKFQKLSPEKYDQMVGNFGLGGNTNAKVQAERHMQQHADDIELYVDPCDYASLRDIGLPPEEIQELSKKLKQEQKDEVRLKLFNY